MRDVIVFWLPFVLSGITVWSMHLAGDLKRIAWLIGLCNQALWLAWICISGTWGFLPLNAAMWWVCYTNWVKWRSPPVRQDPLDSERQSKWYEPSRGL